LDFDFSTLSKRTFEEEPVAVRASSFPATYFQNISLELREMLHHRILFPVLMN
jgi:hypothetical protein